MTLFVRDLPRDAEEKELIAELQDLPQGRKEAKDHAIKVEFAEKHLKEMERLAEASRQALETARANAAQAEERVMAANDSLLNARQAQSSARLQGRKVSTAMVMKKGDTCSAFVRFESREDANKALQEIKEGSVQICGRIIGAEMARRNTN